MDDPRQAQQPSPEISSNSKRAEVGRIVQEERRQQMKMRRFTPAGIITVKAFLADIKASGRLDLVRRDQLLTGPLTEPIPALADLDLDTARIFDTTFAFCEYFDSLIHDHNPQAYRTDVGFWTWLAMAYLPQLVKSIKDKMSAGDDSRIVFHAEVFGKSHRHLLASPYYLYTQHADKGLTHAPLFHRLNTPGDVLEAIIARQDIAQNEAFLDAIRQLYFDNARHVVKPKVGGPKAIGGIRRFVDMVDQFGRTRDFYAADDSLEFLKILPAEFDRFKS